MKNALRLAAASGLGGRVTGLRTSRHFRRNSLVLCSPSHQSTGSGSFSPCGLSVAGGSSISSKTNTPSGNCETSEIDPRTKSPLYEVPGDHPPGSPVVFRPPLGDGRPEEGDMDLKIAPGADNDRSPRGSSVFCRPPGLCIFPEKMTFKENIGLGMRFDNPLPVIAAPLKGISFRKAQDGEINLGKKNVIGDDVLLSGSTFGKTQQSEFDERRREKEQRMKAREDRRSNLRKILQSS